MNREASEGNRGGRERRVGLENLLKVLCRTREGILKDEKGTPPRPLCFR